MSAPADDDRAVADWLAHMKTLCSPDDPKPGEPPRPYAPSILESGVAPSVAPTIVQMCKHIQGMTPNQERAKACLMSFGYTPGEFDESTFRAASQICGLGDVIGNQQGTVLGTDGLMQCVAHGGTDAPPMCAPLSRIVETARQHINRLEDRHLGPVRPEFVDDEARLKRSLVSAVQDGDVANVMRICDNSFRNQPKDVMERIVKTALQDPEHHVRMSTVSEFVDLPEMCNQFRVHLAHDFMEQQQRASKGEVSEIGAYNDLFRDIIDACPNVNHSTVTAGEVGRALAAKPTESTSICQLIKTHASEMAFNTDDEAVRRDIERALNFTVSFNGGV